MFLINSITLGAILYASSGILDSTVTDSAKPKVLESTVVTGSVGKKKKRESTSTIETVSRSDIERTAAGHPSGLLNRLAGVHISQLSAEGHSASIRQPITTKPMYLYLEDGIPTRPTGFFNHNALYEVNLPQSGGVEVLKGPGTAIYGSDAIGGVINVLTKAPPLKNTANTSLEVGSFGWKRALLSGGLRFNNGGARFDLNVTDADSWRDEAPYRRYSATTRVDRMLGDQWFMKVLATGTDVKQRDLPPVGDSQFKAQGAFNSAPIAYRKVSALRGSVMFEQTTPDRILSFTPYVRYNTLGLLPSWQLSYDPQEWDQSNTSLGLTNKARFSGLANNRLSVVAGMDLEVNPGDFRANQVLLDTSEVNGMRKFASYRPGVGQYDYSVRYSSASPYVQLEAEPISGLRMDIGMRYDIASYSYKTHLSPITTGQHRVPDNTTVSYKQLSPKIGVSYDAARYVTVYGSFRTGFRAPSQGQLFQQNSADNTVDLKAVDVISYELGLRGDLSTIMSYSIAAYDMKISNDIISYRTPANTTEATNAGKTQHRGLETALSIFPVKHLSIDVANSWMVQKYVEWRPSSTVSYDGMKMEQAPASTTNLRVNYAPVNSNSRRSNRRSNSAMDIISHNRIADFFQTLYASAELSRVGGYYMDPGNIEWYNGHTVINANVSSSAFKVAEIYFKINNILNRSIAETASYNAFQGRQYNLGMPRNIVVGIRL